jgi:hypothetical protein
LKIRGDIRGSRCTTGVIDTGGKWEISSIIKVLIILSAHLWEVELTYRYIFAIKFTLRSQQPDIVPIFCRWYQQHQQNWWQNLPPVSLMLVANLPPVSFIMAAILPPVSLTPVATSVAYIGGSP